MDIVEYPSRTDMVAALLKAQAEGIDVETVDGYRTLAFPEGSYDYDDADDGDGDQGQGGDDADDEGQEDDEDDDEGSELPNIATMNRAQLRAVITDNALDIQVPDEGPLGPVRDAITAALGG